MLPFQKPFWSTDQTVFEFNALDSTRSIMQLHLRKYLKYLISTKGLRKRKDFCVDRSYAP